MAKRARESFSGTADLVKKFNGIREDLILINSGSADITFTAGYFTFTLEPGEVFDEEIDPFSEISITANGSKYRGFVREAY